MATPSVQNPPTWDEIERSESYLVCCMFEEAASLASSIIGQLCSEALIEDVEFNDMLESAGMVLVQSLKEIGRTLEILKELKQLFGSLSAIPVQVFITGVCFQMQEDPSGVGEFLEEFLSMWKCMDERYYVFASAGTNVTFTEGCNNRFVLGIDTYLQVVEVYVVSLLTVVLNNMDLATSWVEKASLPEHTRQELLRRVHSMYSDKVTSHSQAAGSSLLADERRTFSASVKDINPYDGSPKALDSRKLLTGKNDAKQAILNLYGRSVPCFWWFRTISLKIGNIRLAVSNGNVLVACLVLLMYYVMRTKKANVTRILKRQALSMKKAAMDLWQLAFSYQVNPLAAVEPLRSATRASR